MPVWSHHSNKAKNRAGNCHGECRNDRVIGRITGRDNGSSTLTGSADSLHMDTLLRAYPMYIIDIARVSAIVRYGLVSGASRRGRDGIMAGQNGGGNQRSVSAGFGVSWTGVCLSRTVALSRGFDTIQRLPRSAQRPRPATNPTWHLNFFFSALPYFRATPAKNCK